MIKQLNLLFICIFGPLVASDSLDSSWFLKNKNSVSIILDSDDKPQYVVKEFKEEANSPDFFLHEVIGGHLAKDAGLLTPTIEILPYAQHKIYKKTMHFGIKTNFILHKKHSCSLNIITNAEQYLKALTQQPGLLDILAFDIATKNIDRRSPNILYVPKKPALPDWYAIDHEWIFSGHQAPSTHVLAHELIKQLNARGSDTSAYETLIKAQINEEHERWVIPTVFEQYPQHAVAIALLLSEPVKRMLPLLESGHIKEIAKDGFKASGVFSPETFKSLDEKIHQTSLNAHLLARLFDESRSLKDDEQLLEQTTSLSLKKDL